MNLPVVFFICIGSRSSIDDRNVGPKLASLKVTLTNEFWNFFTRCSATPTAITAIATARLHACAISTFILTGTSSTPHQNEEQKRVVTRENFSKLFDSIALNDTADFRRYKMILVHETARENQAFLAMKEELKRIRVEKNENNKVLLRLKKNIDVRVRGTAHIEQSSESKSENNSSDHSHVSQFVPLNSKDDVLRKSKSALSSDPNRRNTYSRRATTATPKYQHLPKPGDSFHDLRDGGNIFVDKSKFLEYLLDEGEIFYFMARPPRFGKTVFLQMMESFFRGEQRYFENLTIYERGNKNEGGEWVQYPVIYFDFNQLDVRDTYTITDFANSVKNKLLDIIEVNYKLKYSKNVLLPNIVANLKRREGQPVVILIDNYDVGVQSALSQKNLRLAVDMQEYMKQFFASIKTCAPNLKLVFVTGVSKLALDGLYYTDEKFIDLTHDMKFASAMGLTKNELDSDVFRPFINELGSCERLVIDKNQCKNGLTKEECEILFKDEEWCAHGLKKEECIDRVNENKRKLMDYLHQWYNGYTFAPESEKLLNPFSVFDCLRRKQLGSNYWMYDDYIKLVARELKKQSHPWDYFANFKTTGRVMLRWIEFKDKIPLPLEMLMKGILTIKSYNDLNDELTLDYPNDDVREAIRQHTNDPRQRRRDRFRST